MTHVFVVLEKIAIIILYFGYEKSNFQKLTVKRMIMSSQFLIHIVIHQTIWITFQIFIIIYLQDL